MRIDITELVSSCLTRRRAAEAFQALAKLDDGSDILLCLEHTPFLSVSFLDELVGRLDGAGILPRITFDTAGNGEYVGKLGRVRDVREVRLFHLVDGVPEIVPVKTGQALVEAAPFDTPPRGF
jgi:hypothetical protein